MGGVADRHLPRSRRRRPGRVDLVVHLDLLWVHLRHVVASGDGVNGPVCLYSFDSVALRSNTVCNLEQQADSTTGCRSSRLHRCRSLLATSQVR